MDEQQRFLLKSQLKNICEDLLVEDVFSYLQSTFALNIDDIQLIQLELTSRRKAEKLLSIILSKERNYFGDFRDALKYAEYHHLAGILSEGDDELSESESNDSLPAVETILREGGVPQLPQVYVKRPLCLKVLEDALYQLKGRDGFVILHGMAGCGKTVVASDVLNNEQLLHSCFPGGIFWLTIGNVENMKLLMKMQNLCARLDSAYNRDSPRNVEEARDRLRILFAHEYPRCLLVLDDIWHETDLKYFDVRVRTLVTTRHSTVSDRINSLKIKVPLRESLTELQSQYILAQWTNLEVTKLPPEANQIINECKCYPLAISMIGALLACHATRWSYYLSQLLEKKTSKVRNKLAYQYLSLYDAFAISFDDLPHDLQQSYKMLSVFDEHIAIPLQVLTIFWQLDEVETEDAMEELIGRSLAHSNNTTPYTSYSIHNIQLSFLKEYANKDNAEYHKLLADRYAASCSENFSTLTNDNYIHSHLISHLVKANQLQLAVDLLLDFHWLQKVAAYTPPWSVVMSFDELIEKLSTIKLYDKSLLIVKDLRRLICVHSSLISSSNLIQLVLCQPTSEDVYKLARKQAMCDETLTSTGRKLYFEWKTRRASHNSAVQLTCQLHEGGVNCCKYMHSAASRNVVSCGVDKTIRIWNSLTGEELVKIEGHTDAVNYCEFSPDDKYVVSCSADNSIKIWLASTGAQLCTLESHKEEVTWCQCSDDGEYIVSASIDTTVKLWNFSTGYLYCTFQQHTDVVNCCCFSRDSRLVASSSNDMTIKIWSVDTKELLLDITGDKDFIPFCMFTPDGKGILATSLNFIQMFSVVDASVLWCVEAASDCLSLALSCDGRYLAVTHNDMTAAIFDLSSEVVLSSYVGHSLWVTSVSFSGDGASLITSSHDGSCKVWEVECSSHTLQMLTDIFHARFDDENKSVLVATTTTNQLQLFRSCQHICSSAVFSVKVTCCVLSDDLQTCAVGFADGNINILHVENMINTGKLNKHTHKVTTMTFNWNNLLSCCVDNTCIVWCLDKQAVVCVFDKHRNDITKSLFVHDGNKIISSSYDGTMLVWDSQCGDTIFTCNHDQSAVLSCQVSSSGRFFLSCTADSKCRLWNAGDGSLQLTLDEHDDAVRCAVFSNDDSMFATGSDDGTVKVWHVNSGDMVCQCEGHRAWVLDIKFNELNDIILTVSNNIKWFNLNGDLMQTFYIHGNSLRSLSSTEDVKHCVTIDNLGFLYVLDCLD